MVSTDQPSKPVPEFEFSIIIDIDLPGGESDETIAKDTDDPEASDERAAVLNERNQQRAVWVEKMNWLVQELQKFTATFWLPVQTSFFHIEEKLGPFTQTISDAGGEILQQTECTFWNFDYFKHEIRTLQVAPILDITEESDGTDKHRGYDLSDEWETVVHRKLAGVVPRDVFDQIVELLELRVACLNTGGMMGAPGAVPFYSALDAVALDGSPEGSITSVYACPIPVSEADEEWLLNGMQRDEVEKSPELQEKVWKRVQSFFEEYPNWW